MTSQEQKGILCPTFLFLFLPSSFSLSLCPEIETAIITEKETGKEPANEIEVAIQFYCIQLNPESEKLIEAKCRELSLTTTILGCEDAKNKMKPKLKRLNYEPHLKRPGFHCTLKFVGGKEISEVDKQKWKTLIGNEIMFTGTQWVWDNFGAALRVEWPTEPLIECENKHPHITVALAPSTLPVYSNHLLSREPSQLSIMTENLKLEGKIHAVHKNPKTPIPIPSPLTTSTTHTVSPAATLIAQLDSLHI